MTTSVVVRKDFGHPAEMYDKTTQGLKCPFRSVCTNSVALLSWDLKLLQMNRIQESVSRSCAPPDWLGTGNVDPIVPNEALSNTTVSYSQRGCLLRKCEEK
jgi:hypothetical protein